MDVMLYVMLISQAGKNSKMVLQLNNHIKCKIVLCVSVCQLPYKIKEVELEYDSYNQVPESPIGRDEEPHLYMVPKKYRKVLITLIILGYNISS